MRARDFISEVNAAGELTVDPDLIERFTDRGWEIDGEGRDQIVMSKPGSRTVLKIVGQGSDVRQDVVRRYVNFFREHQRNPHFPRVGVDKTLRWNGKTYYMYTQERLYSLPGDQAVLDYLEQAMAKMGRGEYPDLDQVPAGLTAQQVDGLVQAVDQLYGSGRADKYEYDLGNVANIMQRANGQLVIVDPLSDFMDEPVVAEARASQDGLNIQYEYSDDGKTLYVTAMDGTGERELGSGYFTDTGHGWEGEELQVDERYRGQGIARVMYDFAKSQLGRIVPNANQTDAGRRHWKGKEVWEAEMGENFADGRVKEMAPPPISVQSSTLYHGTPSLSNAQGIMRNGLKFDPELIAQKYKGSKNFSPLPGVYLSKEFGNAVRYSFMSDVPDEQYADYIKQEPYGYVFEFSGKSLSQTSPDEDELGRLLEKFVKAKNLPLNLSALIQGIPEDLKAELSKPNVSFETIAMAGKWLISKLKPQTLQYLMQRYMNVVNYGVMKPIAVWKIPKPEQRFLRDRQGTFDTFNGYTNWANRYAKKQSLDENFADGKKPGRKGLSRRVGIPKKATLGQLEKIAKSSTGERRRMAQWQLNMRRGKARKDK